MIKCVIFDLDGTLLDTLDTIRFFVNQTLAQNGISPITREECRRFVGSGARHLIRSALESRGVSDTATFIKVHSEYVAAYNSNPYYLTRIYDGIEELVASLHSRGIKLAVLSNKPDAATRAAVERFFGSSFDVVRGAMDAMPLKPAPDAAFALLSELSSAVEECAYIGDSDVDVMTAQNFSPALSISVLWGFRTKDELLCAGAEVFAKNAKEVIELIDRY